MTDTTQPSVETWTFLGPAVTVSKKVVCKWRDPSGKILLFAPAKGQKATGPRSPIVGGEYEVRVTRGSGVTMHGTPSFLRSPKATPEIIELKAAARGLEGEIEADKQEAKARKDDTLAVALAPIQQAYWKASTGAARRAILSEVIRIITNDRS